MDKDRRRDLRFLLPMPQADKLFKKYFQLVRSEQVTDSLPFFRDLERWQEWLKE